MKQSILALIAIAGWCSIGGGLRRGNGLIRTIGGDACLALLAWAAFTIATLTTLTVNAATALAAFTALAIGTLTIAAGIVVDGFSC